MGIETSQPKAVVPEGIPIWIPTWPLRVWKLQNGMAHRAAACPSWPLVLSHCQCRWTCKKQDFRGIGTRAPVCGDPMCAGWKNPCFSGRLDQGLQSRKVRCNIIGALTEIWGWIFWATAGKLKMLNFASWSLKFLNNYELVVIASMNILTVWNEGGTCPSKRRTWNSA